jgi:hypothetical protein
VEKYHGVSVTVPHLKVAKEGLSDQVCQQRMQDSPIEGVHSLIVATTVAHSVAVRGCLHTRQAAKQPQYKVLQMEAMKTPALILQNPGHQAY